MTVVKPSSVEMDANFETNLSAQQLLTQRKECGKSLGNFSKFKVPNKVKHLPKSGSKRDELNASLDATLELKFNAIEKPRLKLRKDVGEAVYNANNNSIHVTNLRNKPSFMGFVKEGQTYLHPEEALFLMETEALQMLCNGVPYSIQEAFSVFLKSSEEFNNYKVYSFLSRYGFKLKRKVNNSKFFNSGAEDFEEDENMIVDSEKNRLNYEELKCTCDMTVADILTKEMILDNFDEEFADLKNKECQSWSEIKELSKRKKDHGYFSQGLVIREPCDKHYNCCAGDVSSVRNISEITTAEEIYKKLKDSGPTTHSSKHKNSRLKICFDCYSPSNKKTSDVADYHIVVIDANDDKLSVSDIIGVTNQSNPIELLFAVIRDAEFNFYKFTPFECWDEIPILWRSLSAQ